MNSNFSKQSRFGNLKDYYKAHPALNSAWSIYDPTYHLAVLFSFPVLSQKLNTHDSKIVFTNVNKVRDVIRVSIAVVVILFFGVGGINEENSLPTIFALLCPALISGFAWFSISIGSVKPDLFGAAVDVTKWLLMSFVISLIAILFVVWQVAPTSVSVVFSFSIFLLVISAITYDNVDSTSIGIDPNLLRKTLLTGLAKLNADGIATLDNEEELVAFNHTVDKDE